MDPLYIDIESVTVRVASFGPCLGQRGLYTTFKESNQEPIEDGNTPFIYKRFIEEIEKNNIKDEYRGACSPDQLYFFYFQGGLIEKKEYSREYDKLIEFISRDAKEIQTEIIGLSSDGKVKNPQRMRPPFCVFMGKPLVFTAIRDFYQNFNTVLATLDLTSSCEYSELALREMMNHNFGATVIKVDKSEDLETFLGLGLRKVFVVDFSQGKEIFEKSLQYNYRYYSINNPEIQDRLILL